MEDVSGSEDNDGEINCYSAHISVRQARDYVQTGMRLHTVHIKL